MGNSFIFFKFVYIIAITFIFDIVDVKDEFLYFIQNLEDHFALGANQ